MNSTLDYTRNALHYNFADISICYNLDRTQHNNSINAFGIAAVEVLISVNTGEVVNPQIKINALYFQEILTYLTNVFSKAEIQNIPDKIFPIIISQRKLLAFPKIKRYFDFQCV